MEAGEDGGSQHSCRAVPSARLSCVGTGTSTPPFQGARTFLDPVKEAMQKGRKTGCGRSTAEGAKA